MKNLITDGIKVQTCVTSPPYWGLRDYGHEGQFGLEKTPEEYVSNMVEVFRLVRELLSDDGTLWLNLGDCYNSSVSGTRDKNRWPKQVTNDHVPKIKKIDRMLKPKDLVGIPWRVAFALQADGWYLRSDIIWNKPNPMPESMKDRPTKSHEYIFLLTKSERYYYDSNAIQEKAATMEDDKSHHSFGAPGGNYKANGEPICGIMRNKRSVWTVNSHPYKEAHFATFPPDLIKPCILAGARVGDIVLDPFFGSGTTGEVAESLCRQWIGIELNPQYEKLQRNRTAQMGMVL